MIAMRGHGLDARKVPVDRLNEYLSSAQSESPGLVVLDLDLGRDAEGRWVNAVDMTGLLCSRGWIVLIVSDSADAPELAAAIAAGAVGSVPKSGSFELLLDVVLAAAEGRQVMTDTERQSWLTKHEAFRAWERELSRRLALLSTREREILEQLAEGHRAEEIAERLLVPLATVLAQISAILVKFGVDSPSEAVALIRQ